MLHRLKRRGVAMVEYAVLLALVCSVSVVFLDDGGLNNNIHHIIKKAVRPFIEEKFFTRVFMDLDVKLSPKGDNYYADVMKGILDNKIIGWDSAKNDFKYNDPDTTNPKNELFFLDTPYKDINNNAYGIGEMKNVTMFQDDNNQIYIAWTDTDLSSKKDGDKVDVIISKIGTSGAYEYYVGQTTYHPAEAGNSSNVRILSEDFINDPSKFTKCDSSQAAQDAYYG